MATLTLPWPPTVNHYWIQRVVTPRTGKPFVAVAIGENGKRFRVDVQAAVRSRFGVIRPTSHRLRVVITACPPDRRTRDLSNILKALEDALTHANVWQDDSQIDSLTVERGPVAAPGKVIVEISVLSSERQKVLIPG